MKSQFDIFSLHSNEDTPRGWIWVELNTDIIKNIYLDLLKKQTTYTLVE